MRFFHYFFSNLIYRAETHSIKIFHLVLCYWNETFMNTTSRTKRRKHDAYLGKGDVMQMARLGMRCPKIMQFEGRWSYCVCDFPSKRFIVDILQASPFFPRYKTIFECRLLLLLLLLLCAAYSSLED